MSPTRTLDLDAESRRVLEFDVLLERVAAHAVTPPGRDRVRGLEARFDREWLVAEFRRLEEVQRAFERQGRLVPGGVANPGPAIERLRIVGSVLEPGPLRDLAGFLVGAADVRKRLLDLSPEEFPELSGAGRRVPDLRAEARDPFACIDPEGNLADEASAELSRVRRAMQRVGERLRRQLLAVVRSPAQRDVIRDDYVTQRNGRFVVPVRTDSPRPLAGIVHAASSSGATMFVEPLESVELNNELIRLTEQEQEEQQRVLLAWSDRLRGRLVEVERALDELALLDSLQARALFGRELEACLPDLSPPEPATSAEALRLEAVRHPLLDLQLREQGAGCIPLDLTLDPADRVLVLSGPNTGGKTVALKTLGLATLMAQSGLPVAARTARLPLYRQLRADIGDHQSIEANLSTYSAHVRAIGEFLAAASSPALFLFDEIGSGTDPGVGAALAQAILEALSRPGMTTAATTHQELLKAWAMTTPCAVAAAMEFDVATLQPTYRLKLDAAGDSAGLEIAERLGLDPAIIARAREHLRPETRLAERYARKLQELAAEAEGLRDRLCGELAEAEAERERARREREAERKAGARQVEDALERALGDFRREARRELATITDEARRAQARRALSRAEQRLDRRRQSAARAARAAGPGAETATAAVGPPRIEPGARVRVRSLDREGEIVSVRGDRVDVRLGSMSWSAEIADLAAAESGSPSSAGMAPSSPYRPTPDAPRELQLIGLRVDEAIDRLDRFLDAAAMAGHDEVRLIHGHGTGRLRRAVREYLRGHALVREQRPGRPAEGGDGATIAVLD